MPSQPYNVSPAKFRPAGEVCPGFACNFDTNPAERMVQMAQGAAELASEGFQLFSGSKTKRRQVPAGRGVSKAVAAVQRSSVLEEATDSAREDPGGNSLELQQGEFRKLGLSDWLDKSLSALGITAATAVQQSCIPPILKGKSVIATSHTGSGKTATFALPILQRLALNPYGVFALVLTPTRELAMQLAEQFRAFGAGSGLKETVVIGGLEMQAQLKALAARPHVVIATPGRLQDIISGSEEIAKVFSRVSVLVLDEADRLLEPSFEGELDVIMRVLPEKRQTLLFSATMTQGLIAMQQHALPHAHCFQAYEGLETAKQLKEQYLFLPAKVKEVYLTQLLSQLEELKVRSAMVFCATCRGCHLLGLVLEELGIPCAALHSHQSQGRRLAALDKFRSARVPLLLATDVASRGLDIPTVDLVVNFDLPQQPRDYVHRTGRTARAGRGGWALSFITQYDVELVQKIESLVGHELAPYEMDERETLKNITKVFKARKSAIMRATEIQSKAGPRVKRQRKVAVEP